MEHAQAMKVIADYGPPATPCEHHDQHGHQSYTGALNPHQPLPGVSQRQSPLPDSRSHDQSSGYKLSGAHGDRRGSKMTIPRMPSQGTLEPRNNHAKYNRRSLPGQQSHSRQISSMLHHRRSGTHPAMTTRYQTNGRHLRALESRTRSNRTSPTPQPSNQTSYMKLYLKRRELTQNRN